MPLALSVLGAISVTTGFFRSNHLYYPLQDLMYTFGIDIVHLFFMKTNVPAARVKTADPAVMK